MNGSVRGWLANDLSYYFETIHWAVLVKKWPTSSTHCDRVLRFAERNHIIWSSLETWLFVYILKHYWRLTHGRSEKSACMDYHVSCSRHVAALFMDVKIIQPSSHLSSDLTANPPS
jgi:hypothetical protein